MSTNTDTRVQIIENAHPDDVRPGDHLTWASVKEMGGVTVKWSREGIVHQRDEGGDWITEDDVCITYGEGEAVTHTIRRTVQDLPDRGGVVLVPAEGHEYITATVNGVTYRARETMLSGEHWRAVWRTATGERVCYSVRPEDITPGTWKVADRG